MGEELRPEIEAPDEEDDASESMSEYSESSTFEGASDDDRQDGCEGGGDGEGKKKKKKRKKKKKKAAGEQAAGGGGEATSGDTNPSASTKAENDKRFDEECRKLTLKDGGDLWVKLANCSIRDAKVKRLVNALAKNETVTSLDLSGNNISDEAAGALAEALTAGGAPNLIELDLRGNPLSDDGIESLKGKLQKRKQLELKTGSPEGARDSWGETMPALPPAFKSSPFLQDFVQSEDEVNEAGLEEAGRDAAREAAVLMDEVEQLADAGGSPAGIGERLYRFALGVEEEMRMCQLPMLPNTTLGDLKAFTQKGAENVSLLAFILELPCPSSFPTPYSPTAPVAGAGLHVVGVAMVVAALLMAGAHVIDSEIMDNCIVPRLMQIAFSFPNNNPLQSLCLRIFETSLKSKVPLLWTPMVQPAMGLRETASGSSLQQCLVEAGREAARMPTIGRRSPIAGFAVTVASMLRAAVCRPNKNPEVQEAQEALKQDAEWQIFSKTGGELDQLILEQQGELCGPRPSRETGLLGSCDLSYMMRLGCNLDSFRLKQLWGDPPGSPAPGGRPAASQPSSDQPANGPWGDPPESPEGSPPVRLQIESPALLALQAAASRREAEARVPMGTRGVGAPVVVYGADDDSDGAEDGSEEEDEDMEEGDEEEDRVRRRTLDGSAGSPPL